MDMFFAAVEIKDNPQYADIPIVVYDNQMIMTASYIARDFGIKSGMPLFIGKKLCPELVQIKANYPRYRQIAQEFKELLTKYDPDFESQGLDEASLDATDFLRENQMDHMEGRIFLAAKIRKEIYEKTHLTASVGIGCNKLLAKICSSIKKPNGLTYLDFNQTEILTFMRDLPIHKLQGVGKVHNTILNGLGVKTCKDILIKATEIFVSYTETQFKFFIRSALGIDRHIHEEVIQKSIGVSQTFRPISDFQQHFDKVNLMAIELYERLYESGLIAKTLVLEFKTVKFNVKQRSTSFLHYIFEKQDIIKASIELLKILWPIGEPVRLIGIRFMHLRARGNAIRATQNKSDVVDLSDGSLALPMPEEVVPLRISSLSDDGGVQSLKDRSSIQSANSLDEHSQENLELKIAAEKAGLVFDRSRMNSSNRKALEHHRNHVFEARKKKAEKQRQQRKKMLLKSLKDNSHQEFQLEDLLGEKSASSQENDESLCNNDPLISKDDLLEDEEKNESCFKDSQDIEEIEQLQAIYRNS